MPPDKPMCHDRLAGCQAAHMGPGIGQSTDYNSDSLGVCFWKRDDKVVRSDNVTFVGVEQFQC
jgi:hypothetical protein